MIKAIIIDDERTSRDALNGLINRYCKNVNVIGFADGCKNALTVIKDNPDVEIVFLDIQMPDGSGFKVLEDINEEKNYNFNVVFTTAYDQYAIKAIKFSALDYLLKPINPDDLISAIDKFEKKNNLDSNKKNIKVLLENNRSQDIETKKIVLSTAEGIHVVEINNIIQCCSEDCYTIFYLKDGKKIIVSKTLKEHEELLADYNFIRPHKSHLINNKYIKTYQRNDGGSIIMTDGSVIPVSRRKRDTILDIINNL